jgi:NAD(P)-dependent dehydrogenase (short-subunit alcohol dehydrogenase family)
MAKALAECGAAVAVTDLTEASAQRVADEITAAGGKALAVGCNVLDKESLEAANKKIEAEFGPVSILINGAGGNHPKGTTAMEYLNPDDLLNENRDFVTFYDLDPKGIEFVFNLNFLGTLLPSQAFTKQMAMNGAGSIINISSMNAFCPLTKIPAYSAAKAAVSNFTQWMAVHMAKAGIRVNAIAPGFFLTAQNKALLMNPDGSPTERSEKILNNTPMGEFGKPEDLIGAMLWLVSAEAAGFVTGVVVPVDGGFAAYSGV